MSILAWIALAGVAFLFGGYAWFLNDARGDTRKRPEVSPPGDDADD